ncbi:MAG: fibronectin type III-like domain-contianing protein [Roseburia hominis]
MDAPRYELAVTVKNDGLHCRKEVVQVYVAPKERQDDRPAHELRAFERWS